MNFELCCRLPACRAEVSKTEMFCDEHRALDALIPALFAKPKSTEKNTEPLTGVYILGSLDIGAVKIGIAKDVLKRLDGLQTGFPRPITLFSVRYTTRNLARKIEKGCHDKLKEFGFHLNGEWFEVEPEDAVELVEKIARDVEAPVLTPVQYSQMCGSWDDIRHGVAIRPVVRKIITSGGFATQAT